MKTVLSRDDVVLEARRHASRERSSRRVRDPVQRSPIALAPGSWYTRRTVAAWPWKRPKDVYDLRGELDAGDVLQAQDRSRRAACAG